MIAMLVREVDRLDIWERVQGRLHPIMAHRRDVARRVIEVLEMVGEVEDEFVRLVKARREEKARRARRGSTEHDD